MNEAQSRYSRKFGTKNAIQATGMLIGAAIVFWAIMYKLVEYETT